MSLQVEQSLWEAQMPDSIYEGMLVQNKLSYQCPIPEKQEQLAAKKEKLCIKNII